MTSQRLGAISLSDKGTLRHFLVFEKHKNYLRVLNEVIDIAVEDIKLIANALFGYYRMISHIRFTCITHSAIDISDYALDIYESTHGAIEFQDGFQQYYKSISGSTRRNLKNNEKHFLEKYPNARFRIITNTQCGERVIKNIYLMLDQRLKSKNLRHKSLVDSGYAEKMLVSCQKYGYIGLYEVGNDIAAGVIFCRILEKYFFITLGHDIEYDGYYLGQLCLFKTIEESVREGAKTLHMGWGNQNTKRLSC